MIHITVWHEDKNDEKNTIEIAEDLRKRYPYTVLVRQGDGYDVHMDERIMKLARKNPIVNAALHYDYPERELLIRMVEALADSNELLTKQMVETVSRRGFVNPSQLKPSPQSQSEE